MSNASGNSVGSVFQNTSRVHPLLITPTMIIPVQVFFLFFGCAGSGLLQGLFSSCSVWASHCSGFCWCEAWALAAQASVLGARGLTSCSSWALDIGSTAVAHRLTCSEACGIFLEWARTHVPCLVGRCFTTEPPGKPSIMSYLDYCNSLPNNHPW